MAGLLTLSQMASRVLRDIQMEEDSSTTQALTDAKQYLNERARDIWERRTWDEFTVLGSYTVAAQTRDIALSSISIDSAFAAGNGRDDVAAEILSVREGDTRLEAEDPGAVNRIQPSLWSGTGTPYRYVNLGGSGIHLLGYYSSATALSFVCKAAFQTMGDSEKWILGNDEGIIRGAAGDMIKFYERDENRANAYYAQYEASIAKLVDQSMGQRANIRRFIPLMPWTDIDDGGRLDISRTGSGTFL
jgi:hypothetical protein